MLNYIAIGTGVTLDLQTRTLARTDREASVTLPQSACLCLAAMAEAQGEVLSQEQLMDIGWRGSHRKQCASDDNKTSPRICPA